MLSPGSGKRTDVSGGIEDASKGMKHCLLDDRLFRFKTSRLLRCKGCYAVPSIDRTMLSVLWDETARYTAFFTAVPEVVGTMTKRDDLLFLQNDLEIFSDGGNNYEELEFNTLGTICEAFFCWRNANNRLRKCDVQKFDLRSPRVHFGSGYDHGTKSFWTCNHPRGTRCSTYAHRFRCRRLGRPPIWCCG